MKLGDKSYPKLLKEIDCPPSELFVRGRLSDEDRCVAVVGTRTPSEYGRRVAKDLTEHLVQAGMVIVSGLARGIDTVAHQAAITAGGKTIAVLGTSIGSIYPPENNVLAVKIVQCGGAVVSEIAPQEKVDRSSFAARNRIISGLSLGVLVIEGADRSGTKITAGFALDQGREVWAVPGAINNPLSAAPNELIKLGAKPVTSIEDILEDLPGF